MIDHLARSEACRKDVARLMRPADVGSADWWRRHFAEAPDWWSRIFAEPFAPTAGSRTKTADAPNPAEIPITGCKSGVSDG